MVECGGARVGTLTKGELWMTYTAVYPPPLLRFCLREMVMVNKQALRLASLSRGCQGSGPSSRRGTTALTPKETGGGGVRGRYCLESVCCHYSLPLSSVASYGARQQHTGLSVW